MEVRLIQNTFTDRKLYVTKWLEENPNSEDIHYVTIRALSPYCEVDMFVLELEFNEALVLQKLLNREINSIKKLKLKELKPTKTKSKRKRKQS